MEIDIGINVNAPDGVKISKELTHWQWAGIVVAIVLGLALIGLLIWCACKKCKKTESKTDS